MVSRIAEPSTVAAPPMFADGLFLLSYICSWALVLDGYCKSILDTYYNSEYKLNKNHQKNPSKNIKKIIYQIYQDGPLIVLEMEFFKGPFFNGQKQMLPPYVHGGATSAPMGATMGVAIRPQEERRRTESLFAPEPCGWLFHMPRGTVSWMSYPPGN